MANPFEGEMMNEIDVLASKMKPKSWFVTLFKRLPESPLWELKLTKYMEMSWGQAPIFIHYKLN